MKASRGILRAFALAVLVWEASGAAIIENQTGTALFPWACARGFRHVTMPRQWASAGLGEYFGRATDNILPPELAHMVMEEVLLFERHEREERAKNVEGGSYMHGKGGTFWRPLFDQNGDFLRPRFAIEAAILFIYRSDFGNFKHERVAGGEWWVQRRDAEEDIGFHHDKDEALASNKATMKFPEVSTVTYFSDLGGPTLIFNQTTPDGNDEVPIVPSRGFLSYPVYNRHLLFRGNLQHGVPGKLALPSSRSSTEIEIKLRGNKRVTFLINWWNEKPLGPNCAKVDTKMAKKLGVYNKEGMKKLMNDPAVLNHAPVPVEFETLYVPKERKDRNRHRVQLAGEDLIWYDLPKTMRNAAFQIDWMEDQVFGNAVNLDLQSRVVGALFRDRRSKVLVFIPEEQQESVHDWVLPLAKQHSENLKFVFADPANTQPALQVFGLTTADTPIAVIHTTQPVDKKYVPSKRERELNPTNLQAMITAFFARKLPILGGNDADEDADNWN